MRKLPKESTPIKHTILEKLAQSKLSQSQFNLIMVILRKTYGWGKPTDWISLSQFEEMTGIAAHNCSRDLKKLLDKNVIVKRGKEYGMNKKLSEWIVSKQILSKQIVKTIQTDSQGLSKQIDTKETLTKETIQKKVSDLMTDEDFAEYWLLNKRKEKKKKARILFLKLERSLLPKIVKAMRTRNRCDQWQNVKYVPLPTTWINDEGWNDEIDPELIEPWWLTQKQWQNPEGKGIIDQELFGKAAVKGLDLDLLEDLDMHLAIKILGAAIHGKEYKHLIPNKNV